MSKTTRLRYIVEAMSILTAILCVTFYASHAPTPVQAKQDPLPPGMKRLDIPDASFQAPPLHIEAYYRDKKIQSGVPFQGDDDWMAELQILVTNKTHEE